MQQGSIACGQRGGQARRDARGEVVVGEQMWLQLAGQGGRGGDVEQVPGRGEEEGGVDAAGQDDPADDAGDGERRRVGGGKKADGGGEWEGRGEVQEVDVGERHDGRWRNMGVDGDDMFEVGQMPCKTTR